jgi:hypothetical protein
MTDVEPIESITLGGINAKSPGLLIQHSGAFEDIKDVSWSRDAAANIISQSCVIDAGWTVSYDSNVADEYRLSKGDKSYTFVRKRLANGEKSKHYVYDTSSSEQVLAATVAENMRRYQRREVEQAKGAVTFMDRLGYASSQSVRRLLRHGVQNTKVLVPGGRGGNLVSGDVSNARAIFGPSVQALRGKTRRMAPMIQTSVVAPRVTQVQQTMVVDIIFVKQLAFLIGLLSPLGQGMVAHIANRAVSTVGKALRHFVAKAKSRDFDVIDIRTDGEKSVATMIPDLNAMGIVVEVAGPGQHVPQIERYAQTVKNKVRCYDSSLPYVMTKILLIFCVYFCVRCTNLVPNSNSMDDVSPNEQFTGRGLDAAIDLRVNFGDYVQATEPDTDNTMRSRVRGCIAVLPLGNDTGSVKCVSLATWKAVTRDQFQIVPLTDLAISYITNEATRQGYSRGFEPAEMVGPMQDDDAPDDDVPIQPQMMPIGGVNGGEVPQAPAFDAAVPEVGVDIVDPADQGAEIWAPDEQPLEEPPAAAALEAHPAPVAEEQLPLRRRLPTHRRGGGVAIDSLQRLNERVLTAIDHEKNEMTRRVVRAELRKRAKWHDTDYAFTMTVRAALRERGEEARPVIMQELKQMCDKKVWHAIDIQGLTRAERKAIIRSSMFLKDKYLASGAFEKFKARLVAGGDGQDKELYENLSSPTAATSSVLSVAAIAASENRHVVTVDIGGAFLNADMEPTGVKVHMRLDKIMTSMLVQIDKSYSPFVMPDGCMIVQLDKALYGCVEAASLWYKNLRSKLVAWGFTENPYDLCVFNKVGRDGKQITVALHVDDLLVTCENLKTIDSFGAYLDSQYPQTTVRRGKVIDYIGMTFDFSTPGEVKVTMDNCVDDLLSGCGVETTRVTPAAACLFDVRDDAPKATADEAKWFHSHVAKVLYLAKRAKPECLTAVSFLSTRVQCCDHDDLSKLRRLLGYIRLTRDRGIVLKIGEHMTVSAYIDAAYGVHTDSGKSHTGCVIVLGGFGPVFVRSSKQKLVTKSSTEAELVALSDSASQALHLRNFVTAQGYDVGPAIIYQDNMSCMALMKRGGPSSERSRHINIRHFWLAERVADGEAVIEHLGTEKMFANALTKPVQGAQFCKERQGLTNWELE